MDFNENGSQINRMTKEEADASVEYMGDFMDFQNEILSCKCGWKDIRQNLKFDEKKSTFNCPKCNIIKDE